MSEIIWKRFKLGNLFEFASCGTFALKDYALFSKYQNGLVKVVTSTKDNTCSYIKVENLPREFPIYTNSLTINRNGSIGYCFYQDGNFIIPTGDTYTLLHKNEKFKSKLERSSYIFLSIIITHTFTSSVYGYNYKVNSERFDRELILLPCLEVNAGDDYIWEENGHFYTLAVNYIKQLMNEAKELREQKTIRLYEAERTKYEAERTKYEAERTKYEADYLKEKENVIWKGFKLGDLFDYSSNHTIKSQIKNLHIFDNYEFGTVANVTASKENNGIVGYIEENEEIAKKKVKNVLTIAPDAAYAGVCFYQPDYVISTGHNKLIDINNDKLKNLFNNNIILYLFLASLITKMFCKTFYGFSKSITDNDFKKSVILLPCLEVNAGDDYIWEENGHFYTLAVNYISYLYLSGRVNYNQKLVDNYTYQY